MRANDKIWIAQTETPSDPGASVCHLELTWFVLDRFVRDGSSSLILYAIRLAVRIEAHAAFIASDRSAGVRGLAVSESARASARLASSGLRRKLDTEGLPLLLGWY